MATSVHGIESFKDLVGTHLGYSEWHLIDQAQVDLFADATGDHQWIHVDPEAAKKGPFGGPIAHGYLTLALAPVFLGEVLQVGLAEFARVEAVFEGVEVVALSTAQATGAGWGGRRVSWRLRHGSSGPFFGNIEH